MPFQPFELFPMGARYAEETLRADNQLRGDGPSSPTYQPRQGWGKHRWTIRSLEVMPLTG